MLKDDQGTRGSLLDEDCEANIEMGIMVFRNAIENLISGDLVIQDLNVLMKHTEHAKELFSTLRSLPIHVDEGVGSTTTFTTSLALQAAIHTRHTEFKAFQEMKKSVAIFVAYCQQITKGMYFIL